MISKLVPPHIAAIEPYPPGKPIEELERELGIVGSIKLASNENPLGPSPKALQAIEEKLETLHRYPDGSGYYLRNRIAEKFGVPMDGVVLGNGSNEIIELVIRTFVQPGLEVIVPNPSFLVYQLSVQCVGGSLVFVPLRDLMIDLEGILKAITEKTRLIFINNPNNPTGTVLPRKNFEAFLEQVPKDVLVVVDEAYIEFADPNGTFLGFDYLDRRGPWVVVTRTFSKAYGLAGLRVGYGVMDPAVADYLHRVRQPFNVSTPAQAAALAALDDEAFLEKSRTLVREQLPWLYQQVQEMGLDFQPTQANFFLIRMPVEAKVVYQAMLQEGVIVRAMNSYGLPRHIRINVGTPQENERFIRTLRKVLKDLGLQQGSA
ncbi:histidinol phosphate aminotransferase apoenzyme [Desulfacinum hydrothermale DSM 13146]|uniref:Histidinol-phosphate aminotransferase n=1 Tax=Desulfacinum hydrothermale DSM 13146 TaxID=1121390 RepID=A0A1W1XM20_9BACT|nr:histidinol-phosphate transaminase [Desulfacinum hydrothermale]SMC24902.1 histidinol phosphate aminotransferase apoenzyme [Desulfacinum hydrothermale DSM 13146]